MLRELPIAVGRTPDSVLDRGDDLPFWYCNGRKRHATCSGVAWLHEDHLATVNLLGRAIHACRFDRERARLEPVQSLEAAAWLNKPENIAISPDGALAAITDLEAGRLWLLPVDPPSHAPTFEGAVASPASDRTAHGVAFSRCGRFVAHTTVDKPGMIRVYAIRRHGGSIGLEPFQAIVNEFFPLVPKGIDFAAGGHRVAIAYGSNVSRKGQPDRRGRLGHTGRPRHRAPEGADSRCSNDAPFHERSRPCADRVAESPGRS